MFIYQNFYNFYPPLIKTRRYKMLIKICKSSYNGINLIYMLLALPQNFNLYRLLTLFTLSASTWYFYKKLFIKNVGILVNNLHQSYNYWLIRQSLNYFSTVEKSYTNLHGLNVKPISTNYVQNIKIINFTFKKKVLNKTVINILYNVLSIWSPYLNKINMTYSFLFITNICYFMFAYNFYYFKVYNY